MAEVIDIVQRLTFDVQGGSAIESVSEEFAKQVKLITVLQGENAQLQQQLRKIAADDLASKVKINEAIQKNTSEINKATEAIGKEYVANEKLQKSFEDQIGTIQALTLKQQQLTVLRNASNDPAKIADYNRELGVTNARLQQLSRAAGVGAGQFNSLGFSISNVIRDAPYGFIGIANNIGPLFDNIQLKLAALKAEGKSSTLIFNEIGSALFGLTGIINLAVVALSLFGDELFKSSNEAKKAKDDIDKYSQSIIDFGNDARKTISKQTIDLNNLVAVIENNNQPLEIRKAALKQLRGESGLLLQSVKDQTILDGKATEQLGKVKDAINARAEATKQANIAASAENEILKKGADGASLLDKRAAAQERLNAANRAAANIPLSGRSDAEDLRLQTERQRANANIAKAQDELNVISNRIKDLQSQGSASRAKAISQSQLAAGLNFKPDGDKGRSTDEAYRKQLESVEAAYEKAVNTDDFLKLLYEEERAINEKYTQIFKDAQNKGIGFTQEQAALIEENERKEQRHITDMRNIRLNELNTSLTQEKIQVQSAYGKERDLQKSIKELSDLKLKRTELTETRVKGQEGSTRLPLYGEGAAVPVVSPVSDKELNAQLKGLAELEKKRQQILKDRQEAEIAAQQETYTALLQISDAYFNERLRQLDSAIAAEQTRVNAAQQFIERGNVEAYKKEVQRLEDLQKERELTAKRQIEINGLIQASNSAVALSESIGAIVKAAAEGDPYTIAFRVAAAVAALVAGIASLKSAFSGFKDGVVDYNGKGTGTSDSNVVRISKGESVITAAATAKYKPVLEMMNKGLYIPELANNFYQRPQNVNMKDTNKKLDNLIEAVDNSKVKVTQKMDSFGFSQEVEKYSRRDKARWR